MRETQAHRSMDRTERCWHRLDCEAPAQAWRTGDEIKHAARYRGEICAGSCQLLKVGRTHEALRVFHITRISVGSPVTARCTCSQRTASGNPADHRAGHGASIDPDTLTQLCCSSVARNARQRAQRAAVRRL